MCVCIVNWMFEHIFLKGFKYPFVFIRDLSSSVLVRMKIGQSFHMSMLIVWSFVLHHLSAILKIFTDVHIITFQVFQYRFPSFNWSPIICANQMCPKWRQLISDDGDTQIQDLIWIGRSRKAWLRKMRFFFLAVAAGGCLQAVWMWRVFYLTVPRKRLEQSVFISFWSSTMKFKNFGISGLLIILILWRLKKNQVLD